MADAENLHGTCVDIAECGVLLRGPPGAGKSDLALRLIEDGARLVADDRVEVVNENGDAVARAAAALKGLLEVRGLGIVRLAPERCAPRAVLRLVVDLVPGEAVDRLPDAQTATIAGAALRCVRLDPFAASAPAKVRLATGAGPGSIMTAP